jgi:hypothetical protein
LPSSRAGDLVSDLAFGVAENDSGDGPIESEGRKTLCSRRMLLIEANIEVVVRVLHRTNTPNCMRTTSPALPRMNYSRL